MINNRTQKYHGIVPLSGAVGEASVDVFAGEALVGGFIVDMSPIVLFYLVYRRLGKKLQPDACNKHKHTNN